MRILLIILLFLSFQSWGQNRQFAEEIEFPQKINHYKIEHGLGVYDRENFLSKDEEIQLNNFLTNYFNKSNRTISIITLDSIAPYNDILDLITDLGNSIKQNKEGFIIAITKYDRKVAVVPTIASEELLNQSVTDKAVFEILIPNFKEGNFYIGIQSALEYLIQQWE